MISFYGGPNGIQGVQGIQGDKGESFTITDLKIIEENDYSFTEDDKEDYNSKLGTWLGVYFKNTESFKIMQYQTGNEEVQSFLLGTLSQPLWYKIQNNNLVASNEKIYLTRDSSNNLIEGQLNFTIDNNKLKISTKFAGGAEKIYESPVPYELDNENGYLTSNEVKQDQIGDIKLRALEDDGTLTSNGEWVKLPYTFNQIQKEEYPLLQEKYSNDNNIDILKNFQKYNEITQFNSFDASDCYRQNYIDKQWLCFNYRKSNSGNYFSVKINLTSNSFEENDTGYKSSGKDWWDDNQNLANGKTYNLISSSYNYVYEKSYLSEDDSFFYYIKNSNNSSFYFHYFYNNNSNIILYDGESYAWDVDNSVSNYLNFAFCSLKDRDEDIPKFQYIIDKKTNVMKEIDYFVPQGYGFIYNNIFYFTEASENILKFYKIESFENANKIYIGEINIGKNLTNYKIQLINNSYLVIINNYIYQNNGVQMFIISGIDQFLEFLTNDNITIYKIDNFKNFLFVGDKILNYGDDKIFKVSELSNQFPITHSFTIPKVTNVEFEYLKIK